MHREDLEQAATLFKLVTAKVPKMASLEERDRKVKLILGSSVIEVTVDSQLGDLVTNSNTNLEILENPDYVDVEGIPIVDGGPDPDIISRVTVGGARCDCCGKSRKDMKNNDFEVCARCKVAYYCSRECQTRQWNAGHNTACRKSGQIKRGDYMLLKGTKTRSMAHSCFVLLSLTCER